jgi:hypothetical protein
MTGWRTLLTEHMPHMLAHEGHWDGIYRHQDNDGQLLDQHRVLTHCVFHDGGEFAYVQHNDLIWNEGRKAHVEFGGVYRDGRLYWDTDRFSGYGWESEGLILLRLERLDAPGEYYTEMIEIAADGQSRARTWQWFRSGIPYKRTLCDEKRVN